MSKLTYAQSDEVDVVLSRRLSLARSDMICCVPEAQHRLKTCKSPTVNEAAKKPVVLQRTRHTSPLE
jgi:hypothetical protein